MLIATAVAAPPRAARAQAGAPATAAAIPSGEDLAVRAREAFRLKDKAQLFALRQAAAAQGHPLASWIEYWELGNRLADAQPGELEAFFERWRGTYVEDRLRNDWLLELGRRRDWANLRAEFPRFRMNDDREVACYALLATFHEGVQDVRAAARHAWLAQRELDEGCQQLAQTMFDKRLFGAEEAWQALRVAVEANRPRLARERAALFDAQLAANVDALFKDPGRLLREKRGSRTEASHQLAVLALWRLAATDPDLAFTHIEQHEAARLPAPELARAWAGVARQAALKQHSPCRRLCQARLHQLGQGRGPRPADAGGDSRARHARRSRFIGLRRPCGRRRHRRSAGHARKHRGPGHPRPAEPAQRRDAGLGGARRAAHARPPTSRAGRSCCAPSRR